jgi:hypothetical protein
MYFCPFRSVILPDCFIQATVLLLSVFSSHLVSHLCPSASVTSVGVPGIDNVTRIATLLSVVITLMIGTCVLWGYQGGVEYNANRSCP